MKQTAVQEFTAEIKMSGINPYIDIPAKASLAFGKRTYVPVKGSLNDTPVTGTLVPTGNGRRRLYINVDMRKRSQTKAGDKIVMRLEIDTKPRPMILPEPLKQALEKDKEAQKAFEEMTPSRRKEILAYLNYLKTPAALERNIRKVLGILNKTGGIEGGTNA